MELTDQKIVVAFRTPPWRLSLVSAIDSEKLRVLCVAGGGRWPVGLLAFPIVFATIDVFMVED